MAPYSSWQVGGLADYLVMPTSEDEIKEAVQWAHDNGQPVTVIGGGTNVLISDKGVRGLVIVLRKFEGLSLQTIQVGEVTTGSRIIERLMITCYAGTSKSELLKAFLKHKLAPALFLAGLPGDVGGGIVMNAGVGERITPREFVEIVDWIEVLRWDSSAPKGKPLEFKTERLAAGSMNWSYRHCEGWRPGIITRVGISWPLQPIDDVLPQVKQANQIRLSKQPLDMPSCGSVFVNPEGHKSGQLIEEMNLKGYTVGGAKVSEKHANFIVNTGQATANDIHQVIEHVRASVLKKTGVRLKTEVVYLGEWA